MYISPPNFIRRIFPSLIWTMPETDRVYLTFDDGPTPGVTEWIVDQLARYDAKATFFCLGKNAEQHPHLLCGSFSGGSPMAGFALCLEVSCRTDFRRRTKPDRAGSLGSRRNAFFPARDEQNELCISVRRTLFAAYFRR